MNIFSQYFGRYLASRRGRNLFRRQTILESLPRSKRADRLSVTLNRRLIDQARQGLPALLVQLGTSMRGLSESEADVLREQHGPNEVEHERPIRWWKHLWLSYNNPFNLLLSVLAAVSWFTRDNQAAIVIGSMVLLATLIRFVQEHRSNRAAQALKEQVSNTTGVRRRVDHVAAD